MIISNLIVLFFSKFAFKITKVLFTDLVFMFALSLTKLLFLTRLVFKKRSLFDLSDLRDFKEFATKLGLSTKFVSTNLIFSKIALLTNLMST